MCWLGRWSSIVVNTSLKEAVWHVLVRWSSIVVNTSLKEAVWHVLVSVVYNKPKPSLKKCMLESQKLGVLFYRTLT